MKKLNRFLFILIVVIACSSLFSCQSDETYLINDIVTVVPDEEGSFYLVTDSGETLEPAKDYNFRIKKKQRAIIVLSENERKSELFDYVVNIHRLDTFLTKSIVEYPETDNSFYGNDPINIHKYWIGDGYLNLWFGSYWGDKTHFVNLLQTDEEKNPYQLEFRHNAYKDVQLKYGYGIVAFDLSSLPETEGKTVNLTVKVKEYTGEKTYTIPYNSDIKRGKIPEGVNSLFNQSLKYNLVR